jgi:AraC-like DNA-binding protein
MGNTLNAVEPLGGGFRSVDEQVFVIPRHGRHEIANQWFKLVVMLEGDCLHTVDDDPPIRFRPGDVVVVPRMGRQYYLALGPRASLRVHGLRLIFDPAVLPAYPADHRWTPPTGEEDTDFVAFARHHLQEYRHLDTHSDETIRNLLAELRDEAEHRRPGYRFRARALCTDLVVHVVRTLQQLDAKERTVATKGRKAAHLVMQAREYLVKNLTEEVTLSQAAAHLGVSSEHLARKFKQETGQTVLDCLRGLRLEKAKTYLLGSGQPVTAIARLTGFSSVALFSRTFKRYVGHSPLAYRQERWEETLETPQVERSGR